MPTIDRRRQTWIAALAVAAMVGWIVAVWQWNRGSGLQPFFQRQPLADLYLQTVAAGFQPYYRCDDDARFAQTFLDRQGQALRLRALPPDRRMLGLSYPGGISRDTTAMLCEVNDKPVMVFVDREAHDAPEVALSNDPALHVFRSAQDGLVMYEVTPWEAPRMMEYLSRVPRSE